MPLATWKFWQAKYARPRERAVRLRRQELRIHTGVGFVWPPIFPSARRRSGILRVAGTMAELLVATAAVHLLPSGMVADIALLAIFSLMLRWIGPANYGIFVVAVSGIVVLLIAMTGVNPKEAIVARAINTAL